MTPPLPDTETGERGGEQAGLPPAGCWPRWLRAGWVPFRMVLDWLIPPCCAACGGEIAAGDGLLCGACFTSLRFIHPPFCDACALPVSLEDVAERGWLCETCEETPPLWRRARAPLLYEEQARQLVLGLKYGNRSEHAALLARFMLRAGAELFQPGAVLVPVPVHRWRLWQRGYNQATLMAMALSRATGLSCCHDGLRRRFRTRALAGLSRAGRQEEVRDVMMVEPRRRDFLRDRPVILVDDIMTTGATVGACTKALLENGCVSVDSLVATRVTPF